MWAICRRHSRFWTPVSTSRTTVKIPSRNTTGSTVATSGTNACLDPTENPMATSELDNAMTYNDALVPLSLTVVLAVDWSTKCSVVSAAMNACSCLLVHHHPLAFVAAAWLLGARSLSEDVRVEGCLFVVDSGR